MVPQHDYTKYLVNTILKVPREEKDTNHQSF